MTWVDADRREHGCGDFSGEGAFFGVVHVLRADRDAAAGESVEHDAERDKGWADDDFVTSVAEAKREQGFGAGASLLGGLVHLPVGCDQGLTGHLLWCFLLVILEQMGLR